MEKIVFIIDDSIASLTASEEALENHYTVMTMQSGSKAISLLEKVKPDLILLDIEMPDMDGFDVLSHLKHNERFKDIPIIFLTALRDAKAETKALEMGVVDFIIKPISTPVLLNRIRLHIDMSEAILERTEQLTHAKRKEWEAGELTQMLLDASPMLIEIWDEDFNIINCNRQTLEMFDLSSKEEYISRYNEFSPEFQPCGTLSSVLSDYYADKVLREGIIRHEWMHQFSDGKPLPVEVTCVRVELNGKVMIVGYTHDLRGIKEAIAQTSEADERASLMMDATPLSCFLGRHVIEEGGEAQFEAIDYNKAALELFGFSTKDEAIARFYEIFPKLSEGMSIASLFLNDVISAFEKGSHRFEFTHRRTDGELIPCEVTLVRVSYKGRPAMACYQNDLRPIKAAMKRERELEIQLREQEMNERIRLMFNAAPLAIEYWDKDHRALDCNQTTLDYYRFSSKEEYSGNLFKYAPDFQPCGIPSKEYWNMHLDKIFADGSGSFEFFEIHDGKETFQEVDGVRTEYNDDVIVITYTKDVTLLKEMQKEKQRIEIAEESSRAKSKFLARMSHEIRTPISAVLGISEIQLQNPALPITVEESFAKIYDSSNILLGIVNDILDLSKIEAGKMDLLLEEYGVASLIVDAVQPHIVNLNSKDIEFHVRIDENLPEILVGDALRIKQIINNILSNAFKYTESGSVELSLQCQREEGNSEENYVRLVIVTRDTGLGMTSEQLDMLYHDYTRFHEREIRSVSGTGLGMPILYSLAEMMGANVDIESEVGSGTSVTVSIPQKTTGSAILGKDMAESLQRFEVSEQSVHNRFKFVPEPMPYGRVLVVDDVSANLYVARGLLAFYSLQVETCESGYDAIEKIKEGNVYDIVFMDQMMPGLNGTETMHRLRDMGYTETIVTLTANALIGQAEEFIKSGFDGFISKPIQTVHLNTILIKYIKDKQPPEVIEAAVKNTSKPAGNIDDYQHDAEVLETLRSDFAKKQTSTLIDIRKALDTGNIETAHRLAHTLKGLAGLINEAALSQSAKEIENLLENGEIPTDNQLSALDNKLTRILEGIVKPKTKALELSANKAFDRDKAFATFDKLSPLLESRSSGSLNLLDELRMIPETAVLVRQIKTLNFAAALKTLNVLKDIFEDQ
ncbi:MAG: response regulator [Defluviitaleaceae bacterium]|nr:response regulator [Defluviitaleaceae bacterium]